MQTHNSTNRPLSPDLELEAILRRMGDYKDLVEMADLITACLSDDSEDVPDLPDPPCIDSPGADSAGDAASVDADSSADAEASSETIERSELVLQLIPTDAPWAIVFLSSFSAVTLCVGKTKLWLWPLEEAMEVAEARLQRDQPSLDDAEPRHPPGP